MSIAIPKQPRPLPASQSFDELKRRACESVLLPRDPAALAIAGDAVNDGLRRMNVRRWRWSVRTRDIGIVADKRDYEIPTDYASVCDGTWLTVDKFETFPVIEFINPIAFNQRFFNTNGRSKEAFQFTVRNEYEFQEPLRLSYPIDEGRVAKHPFFRLSYYSNLPRLNAPGDTFQAPSEIELWILNYAESRLSRTYAPERYVASRREAELLWQDIAKSDMRRGTRAM